MVRSLLVALALAIAAGPDPLSAQVTADLHTMSRPHVVGPAEGQQRILPDGRAMLLKVGPSTTGAAYLFLGAEDLPPGASVPRHRHELDEEILIVQRGDLALGRLDGDGGQGHGHGVPAETLQALYQIAVGALRPDLTLILDLPVEQAEAAGLLKPGDTIVEATSGNTGNALSMVAAVKGYRMIVVMPEGLSNERVAISRAYGAEVLLSGNFHVNEALERARELGQQPGFFFPGQFESEWNVQENREILGPEILAQLPDGRTPDAFVHGVGTGGTLIGVGQAFRAANPDVRLFAMEPSESPTLLCGEVDLHGIEGISDGFVPGIFARHRELVSDFLSVSSADAVEEMRKLASKRGLLCGPSSGAHVIAARRIRERFPELETVVTVLADKGEKYLHDFYMSQPGEPDTPPLH